jgi:hypothetical protein
MNRRLFGAFGVLTIVTLSVGSCKSDPLSDVDGSPAVVVTDFSYLQMPIGSTNSITASVLDARTNALAVPITFTACTGDVTVVPDPDYNPVPNTSARAIVTANTPNPSCVRVEGGGLEDTVQVAVLPEAFNGTASSATPMVGQSFSLYASSLLGFDVDSANIDFGDGIVGEIIRRVGDTLTVRVPQPDAMPTAPLSVLGIAVKYVPGLTVDLPTATNFTVTPFFARASGGAAAFVVPADGDSTEIHDGFATDGTDYWYPFTVASTDTLVFTLSWDGDADLDMAACNGVFSGCTGGFGAATGANPETFTVIFAAGNYNILIEQFDTHDDPAHLFTLKIKNP